jgi:methyltransferase-like protein
MGVVRDMMRFHTRGLRDPHERVRKARELLSYLCQTTPGESSGYDRYVYDCAQFLQSSLKGPRALSDAFMLHDELQEINEPTHFYQFAEHAAGHGLQYLGEAELCDMAGSQFAPPVLRRLNDLSGSVVELEQYMDFYRNQMFRRTLLCHERLELSRTLTPERIETLYVSSRAQLVGGEQEIRSRQVSRFRGSDGTALSTDHPVTKAALGYLARHWPQVVPFDGLLAAARALLDDSGPVLYSNATGKPEQPDQDDAQVLATNLLEAYTHSTALVELHAYAPQIALQAGERPQASPVARLQAQNGSQVTNLRHERVELDRSHRHLLRYLGGNHDRAAIIERLSAGPVADGTLVFEGQHQPIRDPHRVRALLAKGLETRLDGLASMALLTA